MQFAKTFLGSQPPAITAIKVYPHSAETEKTIRVDAELQWVGNPCIVLMVGFFKLPPVAARLENLTITATIRLELLGLNADTMPGFDTIAISFLKKPVMDYTLWCGMNVLSVDIMSIGVGRHNLASGEYF